MNTAFAENIILFNNFVTDLYANYKDIYRPNKTDKCYLHVNPIIFNLQSQEAIYNVTNIVMYDNTVNMVTYSKDWNIKIASVKDEDLVYMFDVIRKTFIVLSGSDILKMRDYLDYDKCESFIDMLLSGNIKSGKYLLGSGDVALHFENYIVNVLLTDNTDLKTIVENSLEHISKIYHETVKNLSQLELYFDFAINLNGVNNLVDQYKVALQIDLLSIKVNENENLFKKFVALMHAKYSNYIIDINLKKLQKSVFTNVDYSISIVYQFNDYFELLFFITMLDVLKRI